jgi:5-(carboxyamino)imidazole ribonucleotide synthase
LSDPNLGHETWTALGHQPCVVEQRIEIAYEISVLVARRPSGELAVYPPSRNHHTRGVLTWAVVPAELSFDMTERAELLAAEIATRLGIIGLLAVECFVTTDGTLLVNELAPRPHNTYHHSERGNATSQFEQLVRAVCNLPLGDTTVLAPAAIVNLLGEVWLQTARPHIEQALAVPSSRLHLYGKSSARAGRKMGHLSAIGPTAQDALARALASYRLLAPDTTHLFDVHEPLLALPAS